MPNYRRYYLPDSIIFITQVTKDHIEYLVSPQNLEIFWVTLQNVQMLHAFNLIAYVILPDHFHFLMRIEDEVGNFSKIMQSLKRNYTINFKKSKGIFGKVNLWQRGFWDHVIRDESDLRNHIDYIHWNPVKHGYVKKPEDWDQSTYRFWLNKGFYGDNWGVVDMPVNIVGFEFE